MSSSDAPSETVRARRPDPVRPPAPDRLPLPVTDSHCHLDVADDPEGAEPLGPAAALAAAAAVNVTRVVQVGCDVAGSRWATKIAQREPSVLAAVALHPNEAPLLAEKRQLSDALSEIESLLVNQRVRAVGETGLDFFRTGPEGRAAQEESFRAHIAMAKAHGRALVIHDRDAHDDVLRGLEDEGAPERTVFHCFSGDARMAQHCVERGWFLSFAGTVTFKNAQGLRDALAVTPLENVLVETDAPYLTPTPHRGRPNASYLVPLTVRSMAQTLCVAVEDVCRAVQSNAERAFGSW
ncbi:MAG: TatD family hydrolase [Motilibacteraceae bacterium]